jgi:GTP-binding protein LepA
MDAARIRNFCAFDGYQSGDLVKLDVLVAREPVDALALVVHRDQACEKGSVLVRRTKEPIPRQLFAVPIRTAIDGRIFSRATVEALCPDVLSRRYGGDVTRKCELLERQKAGKELKQFGQVVIPLEAFLAVLRLEED